MTNRIWRFLGLDLCIDVPVERRDPFAVYRDVLLYDAGNFHLGSRWRRSRFLARTTQKHCQIIGRIKMEIIIQKRAKGILSVESMQFLKSKRKFRLKESATQVSRPLHRVMTLLRIEWR